MDSRTFYIESLGCAKNTVDSSSMSSMLRNGGYKEVNRPTKADFLIVNTCGFIQAARDESIKVLSKLANNKKKGQLLIAAGCLTERYREQVAAMVPGIDGIIGTRRWMDILELLQSIQKDPNHAHYHLPEVESIGADVSGVTRSVIQGGSAYLKIADGCRRNCAFCAIPLIKGTAESRPIEAILEDARLLQDASVKELILIAQDTTDYGTDLGMKGGLVVLLKKLITAIPHIPWLRILYTYPGFISDKLIELMATQSQLLHYLDIPLQHAHPALLKSMNRPSNMDEVRNTISKMRKVLPDLAIRSTFVVGFPGETEQHFQTLLDFVQEIQFDHVGAFTYSFELGTPGEALGDPIPMKTKKERLDQLLEVQQNISLLKNQKWIGKEMQILVEGCEKDLTIGRSFRDAPEIDGLVIAEGHAKIGELVNVHISSATVHDLFGVLKNN